MLQGRGHKPRFIYPMRRPFLAALAVRVACALAIATAFAPDEYWQSLEVAHRLVFG